MTDLAVVIPEPEALDLASVPALAGAIIAEAAEVEDIPTLEEMRARTAAISVYLSRKNKNAAKAMNAADLALKVRIGELLGPAEPTPGPGRGNKASPAGDGLSPGLSRRQVYKFRQMAEHKDVPEVAEAIKNGESQNEVIRRIEAAKANNPPPSPPQSRASIAAKVEVAKSMAAEGYTSRQIGEAIGVKNMGPFRDRHGIDVPADAIVGKAKHIDAHRVLSETTSSLEGIALGLSLVSVEDIDPEYLNDHVEPFGEALKQITRFYRSMKEVQR